MGEEKGKSDVIPRPENVVLYRLSEKHKKALRRRIIEEIPLQGYIAMTDGMIHDCMGYHRIGEEIF